MSMKQINNFKDGQSTMEREKRELDDIFGALSQQLKTLPTAPDVLESLEARINNRIQASLDKHAGLRTIRSRAGTWLNLIAGIRYKPLWQSREGNSVLIEFAPGASLPVHRHSHMEEGIVLSGSLQLDDLELLPFDYHLSPQGSHHGQITSKDGGLAFLRGSSVGEGLAMFKEVMGGLLPKNSKVSASVRSNEGGWTQVQDGFYKKELWSDGIISSQFYRLEPGAFLEGHWHPLDEECMILNGEIFLGDILLQEGDYHWAPKGSRHLDIMSETGALLFVRGAAD